MLEIVHVKTAEMSLLLVLLADYKTPSLSRKSNEYLAHYGLKKVLYKAFRI